MYHIYICIHIYICVHIHTKYRNEDIDVDIDIDIDADTDAGLRDGLAPCAKSILLRNAYYFIHSSIEY